MIELLVSSGGGPAIPPGPSTLLVGDSQLGYYGLVESRDLISGSALAALIGLTPGTLLNDTTPWFKFAFKGKLLYVPQKPIRCNLSWNHINTVECVYGKAFTIKRARYLVRLMRGSLNDPYVGLNDSANDTRTYGSEYNELMYRVCVTDPAGETAPSFAAFTQAELGCVGSGGLQLCMENSKPAGVNPGILGRGNAASDFTTSHTPPASLADQYRGWRPVLEVI